MDENNVREKEMKNGKFNMKISLRPHKLTAGPGNLMQPFPSNFSMIINGVQFGTQNLDHLIVFERYNTQFVKSSLTNTHSWTRQLYEAQISHSHNP